jgi:23S rRNA (cytidine1920-2'-O)/16S rRNA (cytidine1409-2'-O)-methyltransferase
MRLDKYLTKNLLDSRTKAIYFIKSSKIKVNGEIITKPSFSITSKDKITLIPKHIYVSKGGYKLESFLKKINFLVNNKVILDIGCSTGGFTNYFLVHNANKVVAVDIAKNILSKRLLNYKNLIYYDNFDILNKDNLCVFDHKFDIISVDLSDVSIKEVLQLMPSLLKKKGSIIALFKPHYEGKKGIVSKDDKEKLSVDFENWLLQYTPFRIIHKINSSERGGYKLTGNREIFYLLKYK